MNEADRLLKTLFDYARSSRESGQNDFTYIMKEYSKSALLPEIQAGKNTLAKRLYEMIKDYAETDPRYQAKLVSFLKTSDSSDIAENVSNIR